jgi:hypothetical protein
MKGPDLAGSHARAFELKVGARGSTRSAAFLAPAVGGVVCSRHVLVRITTIKTRSGAVQAVTGSPDGRSVLVVHGEPHAWTGERLTTAEVFRRVDVGLERTGELAAAAHMYALDDGAVIAVHGDYREVEVQRHRADGALEATHVALGGRSLGDCAVVLEPDGRHATLDAVDRDGGATRWARLELHTGAVSAAAPSPPLVPGPGVPTRSPQVGAGAAARVEALEERVLRAGPTCVLTATRVIAIDRGDTLLEGAALFDLSADERLAVGADRDGRFELRDVAAGTTLARLDPKYRVQCAAFLGAREIVLGTAEGRVLLLGLPDRVTTP